VRWLVRWLLVLLLFGLAYMFLIWNGDILTEYAVAALLVLPMLRARTGFFDDSVRALFFALCDYADVVIALGMAFSTGVCRACASGKRFAASGHMA
jgi:uncharacterized membrane protein YeiB